ncbi:unnamed protein product [Symbiodinium microadriaticum]|nr:unnamed protein product [Symbiodinium microadriaticum]CAE7941899.1 unnamed protein product [Symbiodinium sp. KB8]
MLMIFGALLDACVSYFQDLQMEKEHNVNLLEAMFATARLRGCPSLFNGQSEMDLMSANNTVVVKSSAKLDELFGKPMLGVSLDKSWVVHHAGRQKLKGGDGSRSRRFQRVEAEVELEATQEAPADIAHVHEDAEEEEIEFDEAQANFDRGSELLILILAGALVGLGFAAPMVLGLLYVDLVLLLRYNLRVVRVDQFALKILLLRTLPLFLLHQLKGREHVEMGSAEELQTFWSFTSTTTMASEDKGDEDASGNSGGDGAGVYGFMENFVLTLVMTRWGVVLVSGLLELTRTMAWVSTCQMKKQIFVDRFSQAKHVMDAFAHGVAKRRLIRAVLQLRMTKTPVGVPFSEGQSPRCQVFFFRAVFFFVFLQLFLKKTPGKELESAPRAKKQGLQQECCQHD